MDGCLKMSIHSVQPPEETVGEKAHSIESAPAINEVATVGVIAKTIGVGPEANNSFVYITIFWSFVIGSVTTGALYIRGFGPPEMDVKDYLDMIKGVWGTFIPLITLALGYAFGKGK
jgi:hypothetical protein